MLTDPRTSHAATRRFFESRLWTVISVVFIAGQLAMGMVVTATLHAVVYVIIHFAFASLRRTESIITRERAQLLAMQREAEGQPGVPKITH